MGTEPVECDGWVWCAIVLEHNLKKVATLGCDHNLPFKSKCEYLALMADI